MHRWPSGSCTADIIPEKTASSSLEGTRTREKKERRPRRTRREDGPARVVIADDDLRCHGGSVRIETSKMRTAEGAGADERGRTAGEVVFSRGERVITRRRSGSGRSGDPYL